VFLEYQATEWLAFQAGQFLTPYGIWNIDHGTPTLVGVRRPYIIGDALFPERQTGLEAHGAFHLDRTSFGYHATLSNGRGPLDSFLDLDANKAAGGRLFVRHTGLGTLTLGGSAYYGKYTDRSTTWATAAGKEPPLLEIRDAITEEFTELAMAADLRWEWEGLLVQGEVIRSDRGYADEHRRVVTEGRELQPDYSRLGTYGLIGFRTSFFGAMPYVFGETYDFEGDPFLSNAAGTAFGLNVRPQANVVFKAQYFFALLGDESDQRLFRGSLRRLDLQVAWAF